MNDGDVGSRGGELPMAGFGYWTCLGLVRFGLSAFRISMSMNSKIPTNFRNRANCMRCDIEQNNYFHYANFRDTATIATSTGLFYWPQTLPTSCCIICFD